MMPETNSKPLPIPLPTPLSIPDTSVLDVLIVGAGLSGIGAARHLQRHCPAKTWAILETREALGGTWDLFRYPGIRSDSDMHTLGYSFKPWAGRKAIADGPSILDYIRDTAQETGVNRHIRFGHRVRSASWSTKHACWTLETEQQPSGAMVQIKARFLYVCSGYYSYAQGHQPDFPGQADFEGTLVYPQFWPKDLQYQNKRVIVIGSGATAVTLVPEMAKTAAHVTMLQRSPTYVVSRPSEDALALWLDRHLPARVAYGLTRLKNVLLGMFFYRLARRRPAAVKQHIIKLAVSQLGDQPDAARHFTPSYNPWDQRVCVVPDGDLFRQIRDGKAYVVTDTIERFTAHGIRLASGEELLADVIVAATGLKLNVLGDIAFTVDGLAYNPSHAMAYKGMMLSNLPNLAMAFGYTNASWTLKADLTAGYVCRLLNYMDSHGYHIALPKANSAVAAQPFLGFTSGYVQRAQALLPKQGDRKPWQVHQNYMADLLTIRWGRIADGVMQFSVAEGKL
jgi:cyclohexanone monooxygenase